MAIIKKPNRTDMDSTFVSKLTSAAATAFEGHSTIGATDGNTMFKLSTVESGVYEEIEYYVLPPGTDMKTIRRVMTCVQFLGSSSESNATEWSTWILTLCANLVPTSVAGIPQKLYVSKAFPAGFIQAADDFFNQAARIGRAGGWETADGPNKGRRVQAYSQDADIDAFPTSQFGDLPALHTKIEPFQGASGCAEIEALMGYLGLVTFLSNKTITDTNRLAIEINRPLAVERAHSLAPTATLTGDLRMSTTAHSMVRAAWEQLSDFRFLYFETMSKLGVTGLGRALTALVNVVALLKNSGLHHAFLIHRFLAAYPWAVEIPQLRPSILAFAESVRAYSLLPPDLRPYWKAAMGSRSDVFLRRDMGPLIACAVHTERETSATLGRFYQDPAMGEIVDRFEILRRMRGEQEAYVRRGEAEARIAAAGRTVASS